MSTAIGLTSLFFGVIGAMTAWAAVMPKHGSLDKLSMWYLGFSLTGSELAAFLATGGVVLGAVAWALGAGEQRLGQVALSLHALAVAGLLLAIWRSRSAFAVLDRGLRAALGDDYEQRIAPDRQALIRRCLRPAAWWKPFSYRLPDVEWHRHIDYVAGAHEAHKQQRLDVLVGRHAPPGLRPVLVNIHGGGWKIGDKGTQAMPLLMHMASCGWVVVDADYRLSPGARMPDHIVDVKRAIAWTREHAAEYGGDPNFIAITGGSAGGHLVALAALTPHQKQWQPGFEQADTSVQVALPFYGKYDMLEQAGPDATFAQYLAEGVMPGPRAQHAALWKAMDPATQAADPGAPRRPPFLVVHGQYDVLIPLSEARWFVQRLRDTSPAAELVYVEMPYAQHGFDVPHSLRAQLTVEALQRYLEFQYSRWRAAHGAA